MVELRQEPARRHGALPGPDHVSTAPTWSAMLAWWRERAEPAVLADGMTWSGRELLARAAGAADHLDALSGGDRSRRPVPALVASSPSAFAYVVGGAASGHPLAPIGPRLTSREIGGCVDALGARVLLTDPEFEPVAAEVAATRDCRVAVLDEPPRSPRPLDLDPPGDAVAFVLHTSGTTGAPKAVPYRQDRLAERTRVNVALCSLAPGDLYTTASPFHHIAGFGNHAVALAAGAAVAPMPRFTVPAWLALAGLGVTHALSVPTVLDVLLDAGVLGFPTLRVLQYGGSPIHPETLTRTLAAVPGVDLVDIYGQTEGSPITCLTADDHRRIAAEGRRDLLGSVGRAAPGVELRIADAGNDAAGEVVAWAGHLFRTDGDGWLHTGDVGRLDADGYLFLVGRKGDRIVRGGENVHPLEVEQVLEQHSGVREAAVVGVPDRRWGEVVRAVIVPADPLAPPDPEELRVHARARLAGFKVPTEWAVATVLPRNAAGKLVRRQLVRQSIDE
jgi:acyl-CoA synthetase (AMP-forming)/AMP-acid ligase II